MRNAGKIAAVLSMGMALSAVCGVSAFAADKAFSLDVANWSQQDWNSIAMTNDDTVTSGAIIRSSASTDSDVVGYLYRGAAVNILDKGDTWTQIQSGAVTGYVMNDYLVYGEAAKGLADYYGKEGVVANWNDVNVCECLHRQECRLRFQNRFGWNRVPAGLRRRPLAAGAAGGGQRRIRIGGRCVQDASG